ncbi:MAG: ATP-dependent DNA helicase RecG [Calditrichaeota bacterium]|nr:MAG: ATP-dependent DNA helicase RecG [Calditrichota bacterium]
MEAIELLEIIERGEDSRHQFKRNVTNIKSLSQEICAFANSKGGMLIIGVEDSGEIVGLTAQDIRRLNQLISNAASEIRNPINPETENIKVEDKLVLVVHVPEGRDKPYFASDGAIYVKSGADKRKVTSKDELRRLFQESDILHGDQVPVEESTLDDLDEDYFDQFYQKEFDHSFREEPLDLKTLLSNLNLAKEGRLNVAGLLLFGKRPQKYKPQFNIKAVHFVGVEDTADEYIDSEDIDGKLAEQYRDGMVFILRNLKKEQKGQHRNSLGETRIDKGVFEELLVNALIHRDYFINAPIRLFIFDDRIEIISPGILPNNLTIENIKRGVSNQRNPIIASFATKQKPPLGLPYRGIGTGIKRALKLYPKIEFENNVEDNLFVARINF